MLKLETETQKHTFKEAHIQWQQRQPHRLWQQRQMKQK